MQWVGSPCGSHGPYLFYKAFRFHLHAGQRLLSLGDFFVVRCGPGEPVCIAELQLLWEERTSKRLLSSSKLYFLPEDTPSGRTVSHGEDEVLAVSEKVVLPLEELVRWTVWEPQAWSRGVTAAPTRPARVHHAGDRSRGVTDPSLRQPDWTISGALTSGDGLKEEAERGELIQEEPSLWCSTLTVVLVRSYLQYCRYRAVLARLGGGRPASLLQEQLLLALGGISASSWSSGGGEEEEENAPRVLYCRDTFQHPTLRRSRRRHAFAPNLKGRPRKKKPSVCLHPDSQVQSQVRGQHTSPHTCRQKVFSAVGVTSLADLTEPKCSSSGQSNSNGGSNVLSGGKRARLSFSEERDERRGGDGGGGTEEQAFLVALYKYMKERKTPIQRIPYLGFKQINLWTMFQAAQKLGGYELVTAQRQWKHVYDELGGNPGSTSAATCTRRHYERLILPYERSSRGDQDGPLPPLRAKRPKGSHATAQVSRSGHLRGTPLVKLTNGVHPHEDQVMAPKEQTSLTVSRREALDSFHHGQRKYKEDKGSASEIQLTLKEDTRETVDIKRRSRRSSFNRSSTETDGKIENGILIQSPTTKVLGHCHVALDLWKAETLDQFHVGMVSPTLEHRESSLQSPPTVQDPNSERTDLPQKDDTFMGFTSLLNSPELNPGIMSLLAKKKLTSQVSRAELPSHKSFLQSFGAPSPLINSGITKGVEAEGQPIRPSVIKHVHSFRTQDEGAEKMKEGLDSESTQEVEDIRAPDQLTPLSSHLSIPHVHPYTDSHPRDTIRQRLSPYSQTPSAPQTHRSATTPPVFSNDHYISSHIHNPYRRNKSYPCQAQEQGLGQEQGKGLSMRQGQGHIRLMGMQDKVSADGAEFRTSAATDEQPTDLSLPKASSLKPFTQTSFLEPLSCTSPHRDSAKLTDATSHSLSQNSFRIPGITHHPGAGHMPHMSVCDMNTHPPMSSSRQCTAGDACSRAADTIGHGQIDPGRSDGLGKREKKSTSERKIRAVSPMHTLTSFASSTSTFSSLQSTTPSPKYTVASLCEQRKSQLFGEKCNGSTHAVAILKPQETRPQVPRAFLEGDTEEQWTGSPTASPPLTLLSTPPVTPHVFPAALYRPAGGFSPTELSDLCGDPLGSPFLAGCPSSTPHSLPHHTLEDLKSHCATVLSPFVPPFAVHSFMMQRQRLAQTAASPVQMTYRHPLEAASYVDLHHRLYPVSISSQPTTAKLCSPKHQAIL
ncbi:unnamed protein product, partial [Lota lota]